MRGYIDSKKRLGYFFKPDGTVGFVSRRRYEKFKIHLQFDTGPLFAHVNRSLITLLLLWPVHIAWMFLAGDESMIPWKKLHKWVICIPRKPHPDGMRIYIIATVLSATGRPVALFLLPDLPSEMETMLSPKTVMDTMSAFVFGKSRCFRIPPNATLTMDALFSYTDMLKMWLSQGVLGSVSLKKDDVVEALGYQLKDKHHRVFQDGNVLISVYKDHGKVHAFASSVFRADANRRPLPVPGRLMNLFSTDFLHLLYLASNVETMKYDMQMLNNMCSTKPKSDSAIELTAAVSHNTASHLSSLLNNYPPSQHLRDAISTFKELFPEPPPSSELQTNQERMREQQAMQPQKRRKMLGEGEKDLHRRLMMWLHEKALDGMHISPKQKILNWKQLKQVGIELGIPLPMPLSGNRELFIKQVLTFIEDQGRGQNNEHEVGERDEGRNNAQQQEVQNVEQVGEQEHSIV